MVTDVEIGIGQLGLTEGPGNAPETGQWTALDLDGNVVAEGLIGPDATTTDLDGVGGPAKFRLAHDIETEEAFAMLEIKATHFGHGEAGFRTQRGMTDSSDFYVMDLSVAWVDGFDMG